MTAIHNESLCPKSKTCPVVRERDEALKLADMLRRALKFAASQRDEARKQCKELLEECRKYQIERDEEIVRAYKHAGPQN